MRYAQKRIDELTDSPSQVREDLGSTKTKRDHAQALVDELTINPRNADASVVKAVQVRRCRILTST